MKALSLYKKETTAFFISFLFGIWTAIVWDSDFRFPSIGIILSMLTVFCAIYFAEDSHNPLNWVNGKNKIGEFIMIGIVAGMMFGFTFICILFPVL